jgi:hypothetical protein
MPVLEPTAPPAQRPAARAAVIDDRRGEARYTMFAVRELSSQGAFLASELLLEADEEITLELSRGSEPALRVRARVVELATATGSARGMRVAFTGLDAESRARLEELASPPAGPNR